ncbi:MAG: class I SAM-dependent methyltransferase [Myxococcales bacterium]
MSAPGGAWSTPEGAASWQASLAQRQQSLAAATELLFAEARIRPGMRVLEVGSGTGDLALLAAGRVGAAGTVLATDASAPMLELAARVARDAGLTNVSTRAVRAEELDLPAGSYDAAIARNCLMFVTDIPRALGAIRTALRRGARFAASVWGPLERNPFHGAPIAAVCRRRAIPSPAPEVVRAFSLSEGEGLVSAVRGAGFRGVELQRVAAPRRFPTIEEAVKSAREFPTFVALLGLLPEPERERAWDEIAREWSPFATPVGLELPGEQFVVAGEA